MSEETRDAIGKATPITLQLGVLLAIVGGTWVLSTGFNRLEGRIASLERVITYRWSYQMEREAWNEWERNNPGGVKPDVDSIRHQYNLP